MTASLARAFARTVRVDAITAGPFRTDGTAAWTKDTFARAAATPLGRIGEPEEVIGAVEHLSGPASRLTSASRITTASRFTTGSVMAVDGGMMCSPT